MAKITVTSLGDTIDATDGFVTLREAIEAANTDAPSGNAPAGSGDDIIVFASGLSGSIALTDTLHITSNVSISGDSNGDGSIDVTIDGNNLHQILWISGNSVVTLDALRLTHGSRSVAPAIDAEDNTEVTVKNSEIVDNVAGKFAGAISAEGKSMTIIGSTLSGNHADYGGGAVSSGNGSALTIIDSTISNNTAGLDGGGVSAWGNSSVTIVNTTFSDNGTGGHSSSSIGGALYLRDVDNATLTNVTFSGNAAEVTGGGIYVHSDVTVTITNSTISGNSAGAGSGIYVVDGGTVALANTVVAGNLNTPDLEKDTGTTGFVTQGGNFIGDGNGLMIDGTLGDRVGTTVAPLDAKLGALANNGGLVQTMAPLLGSPLIDGGVTGALPLDVDDVDGDGNTTEALPEDARGIARTLNGRVDIGAVEYVPQAATLAVIATLTSLKETANTSSAIKVADITVSDVDGGTNVLSLTGADKDLFVIQGNELFLKAGAALDFESNPKLDVTVTVDDAKVGATPDASASLSIAITDVADVINGNSKNNLLVGGSSVEIINGKGGDDTIKGGGGADTIRGGAGADVVTGGAGADVFVFKPGDLPRISYLDRWLSPLNGDHDLIKDFTPGSDKIDLSAIDADTHKAGNQKFHFEGAQELSGSRGELVYELYGSKPSARHTIVRGDTNGDGDYDFLIVLKGHHTLQASDFIL